MWLDTVNSTVNLGTLNWAGTADTTDACYLPDSYIGWVPDSCLYVKYIPYWHLIQSYKVD